MNYNIGIIGIGYVGLPLSIEFGKYFNTVAYDVNQTKINRLCQSIDDTEQISKFQFKKSNKIKFSYNHKDLDKCNFFIICVPTPVNNKNLPDLSLLKKATKLISTKIKKNDIIIYESTVFPGTTEDICVPILEKHSKLTFNKDFFCGYSPERINPGDKKNTITSIKKITSGSTPQSSNKIDNLYKKIISAGTYMAESIKIAEAAKVIENTQRDVNIALVNELSIIFNYLKLDTNSILQAASTKWNFLKFKPGLVGGHCIGVDPYYLTYISKKNGYFPKLILSGRAINNDMNDFIIKKISNLLKERNKKIINSKILILGLTFKENCPDFRNSMSLKLVSKINKLTKITHTFDPYLDGKSKEFKKKYMYCKNYSKQTYDVILINVLHNQFVKTKFSKMKKLCKKNGFIYDVVNTYSEKDSCYYKL